MPHPFRLPHAASSSVDVAAEYYKVLGWPPAAGSRDAAQDKVIPMANQTEAIMRQVCAEQMLSFCQLQAKLEERLKAEIRLIRRDIAIGERQAEPYDAFLKPRPLRPQSFSGQSIDLLTKDLSYSDQDLGDGSTELPIVREEQACPSEICTVESEEVADPISPQQKRAEGKDASAEGLKSVSGLNTAGREKKKERRAVFVDGKQLKDKLRDNLRTRGYDVIDLYHTEGCCQRIARSNVWDIITLTLISINAIWIAVDLDWNDADMLYDAHPVFIAVENFFCSFFTFEMLLRYGAFKRKRNAFKDLYFLFDFFLVSSMAFETWIMPAFIIFLGNQGGNLAGGSGGLMRLLRLLRLTKVARVARLLRAVPEILILLKGMLQSLRSVCTTLFLMAVIIYAFAIAFRQLSLGTESEAVYFGSVPQAVHAIFLNAVLMAEPSDVVGTIGGESGETGYIFLFLFYFVWLVCSLTILNMLIGVLVDVIKKVADAEHEELMIEKMAEHIELILRKVLYIEEDIETTSFRINREAFLQILDDPDTGRLLQEVEVDVVSLVDLVDTIFSDESNSDKEKTYDFAELVMVMLEFRKYKAATVADLTQERKYLRDRMDTMITEMAGMKHQFSQTQNSIRASIHCLKPP